MIFIRDLKDGDKITSIYLCKSKKRASKKNGDPYLNLELQDKTGTISSKIWDPDSPGIDDFDDSDYIEVGAEVSVYNSALQLVVRRARKVSEGEYNPADYLPVSPYNVNDMYSELVGYVDSIKNEYLKRLASMYYKENEALIKKFKLHSAAKSVHHGYVGGLLEHTVSVTRFCDYLANNYKFLRRDLLIVGGLFHDIGKLEELSAFPANDYTEVGELIGHIVKGCMMLSESIDKIEGFPVKLKNELLHCILAHHGEYEYGSPKKPMIAEAVALNIADSADAKLEIFKEVLDKPNLDEWQGYNKFFSVNIKRTKGLGEE